MNVESQYLTQANPDHTGHGDYAADTPRHVPTQHNREAGTQQVACPRFHLWGYSEWAVSE